MSTHHPFRLLGVALEARASGALWHEESRLLVVSDLHLGRSERLARRGGALLPPYETRETLARLDGEIEATRPARVICLGDSFDDLAAAGSLDEAERLWLARLMAGRDWVWIEGNHDAGPVEVGGAHRAEVTLGPLVFRHIPQAGAMGEVAGHFHPKVVLAGRSHRAFLIDGARVILPAFGAYTGGLRPDDPALAGLMAPGGLAVLTGARAIPVPLAPLLRR
jgi:DNA ligase-associated metallophosphoesterase